MEETVDDSVSLDPVGLSDFRTDVDELEKINSRIREVKTQMEPLKIQLRDLEKEKKMLKLDIAKYMSNNNVKKCNLPEDHGSLLLTEKKKVTPITKVYIQEAIMNFFKTGPGNDKAFSHLTNEEKARSLIRHIYEDRDYTLVQDVRVSIKSP